MAEDSSKRVLDEVCEGEGEGEGEGEVAKRQRSAEPGEASAAPAVAAADQLPAGPAQLGNPTREVRTLAAPNARLCFTYLNHNTCSRGSACSFRHVLPDHPDAIADRIRTGHLSRLEGILPEATVRVPHPLAARRAQLHSPPPLPFRSRPGPLPALPLLSAAALPLLTFSLLRTPSLPPPFSAARPADGVGEADRVESRRR